MATETEYRIYATHADTNGKSYAQRCRFSRITPQYVLIYADAKPDEIKSIEVREKDFYRLTESDRSWLWESMSAIASEFMENNKVNTAKKMGEMLERFADELENERRSIEGVVNNATTE